MPLSTRELLLTLRARDEASKIVRGLSREMVGMSAAVEAASARASAAALRQQAAAIKNAATVSAAEERAAAATLRQQATAIRNAAVIEAAEARNTAATLKQRAAILQQTGATKEQIDTLKKSAKVYDDHARTIVDSTRISATALDAQARAHDNQARSIIDNARVSALAITDQAKAYDNQARSAVLAAKQTEAFIGRTQQAGQISMTAGAGMVAAGAAVLYGLYKTTTAAAAYEKQVKLTRTQVDSFSASLEELSDMGLNVARSIAVPFEEVQTALYGIFSSTDANLQEAEILLTAFAKAAVAGQVSIQDASRETIAVMNAYNIPFKDVNKVLDVQFQLVRKGVGTYEEFAKVVGNVIPASTRAGQSFEMVGAMLAYLTRNGLSASSAATSAARALEAMSHPKTVERLAAMGIAAYDATGKMRPLTDILVDLRKKLDEVPEPERIKMLVDLLKSAGGTIQARRFLEQVLLRPGELEEFIGYLGDMNNAVGSFENAYGEMADSVASKTQVLKNNWEALKVEAGEALSPSLEKVLDLLIRLFAWFNSLPTSVQNNIIMFVAFAAVLSVAAGILFIMIGVIAAVIAAVAAAGTGFLEVIAIVAIVIIIIVALGVALYELYQRSESVRNILRTLRDYFNELRDAVSEAFDRIKAAYNESLGPALEDLWNTVETKILPMFNDFINLLKDHLIPKVEEVSRIIGDEFAIIMQFAADVIEESIIPALESLANWWKENKDRLEPYIDVMSQLLKIIVIVAAVIIGSFILAILMLIAAAALIVTGFFKVVEAISDFWNWIKKTISKLFDFKDSVKDSMGSAVDAIGALPGKAKNAIGDLGNTLWNAGKTLIQGFINGVDSMIGTLKNKLSMITNMLPDWKGPATLDARILRPTGHLVMQGFMRGIDDVVPSLKKQLADITKDAAVFDVKPYKPPLLPTSPTSPSDSNVSGTTINQTFNITTQEISPERHASDLGYLLAGR